LHNSATPNDIWCLDFKGQFRLGNRQYCYPLTVSVHYSRYLLLCDALESTKMNPAQASLAAAFSRYGLPRWVRSDNGAPFASHGRLGLSKLSVWLLRLGIQLERIEPGHPEQNGRHERMHLTLKQDATRPPGRNIFQQQDKFDTFQHGYNAERPHESLNMQTPSSVYEASSRRYEPELPDVDYPLHDFAQRVRAKGMVRFRATRKDIYVGEAFAGHIVGFRELNTGSWLVSFMHYELGYLDVETNQILQGEDTLAIANTVKN